MTIAVASSHQFSLSFAWTAAAVNQMLPALLNTFSELLSDIVKLFIKICLLVCDKIVFQNHASEFQISRNGCAVAAGVAESDTSSKRPNKFW